MCKTTCVQGLARNVGCVGEGRVYVGSSAGVCRSVTARCWVEASWKTLLTGMFQHRQSKWLIVIKGCDHCGGVCSLNSALSGWCTER